jgi:hypothetical protein
MSTTTTSRSTDSTGATASPSQRHRGRRGGRSALTQERHRQAWEERRRDAQQLATRDAKLRLRRGGRDSAVRDALAALAHASADPWHSECRQLAEAADSGRTETVTAAAGRGARKAAGDAVRGGAYGPDADIAIAVATAFKVIQFAPGCHVKVCQQRKHEQQRRTVHALASRDASMRLRLQGARDAVRDAAGALAHPSAEPWQPLREQLAAAARTGSETAVGKAAQDATTKAVRDATSSRRGAPDRDLAVAVATAYRVIQFAPRCLLELYSCERTRSPRARTAAAGA